MIHTNFQPHLKNAFEMFWLWQQSPMGLVGLINLDNEFGLAAFWKESSETSTSTVGSSSTSFYYYNAVRAFQMRNGGLVKNCSLPQLSLTVLFPMYHTHTHQMPPFPFTLLYRSFKRYRSRDLATAMYHLFVETWKIAKLRIIINCRAASPLKREKL